MPTIEPVEVQLVRCNKAREVLRNLARLHVDIDAPRRSVGAEEPDWVLRLRKVCYHTVAATDPEFGVTVDGAHIMTTELRAAYEQMDTVWKCLPDEFRFEQDRNWWSREARDGLAAYNHPTPLRLALPFRSGGFGESEEPASYLQLALWLGPLACAYAFALDHLARTLGTGGTIDSRLIAILSDIGEKTVIHAPPSATVVSSDRVSSTASPLTGK